MEKALQDDLAVDGVLVDSLGEGRRVVLEVCLQLLVVNRQEGHTLIEVFGFFVETECHCLRVDEQLVCIRLLFLDLKHLFLAQASLLSLKSLLGGAGILLSLFILLLLKFVFLGLVSHADWDGLEFSLVGL